MGDNVSKKLGLISATDAEMEERSFSNRYPDWAPGRLSSGSGGQGVLSSGSGAELEDNEDYEDNQPLDAEGKVSAAFQKKVENKIKDLLQQMEEGLKTADPHDFSVYTGWTGIALLYLQLHRVSHEATHLQRALDYVKRTMRILNGRKVTFLCGDAGPLAVGAVVHHKLNNTADSQDCLSRLLQLQRSVLSPDSEMPDELLYGRAGYLYALLYINKEMGADTVDESTITKVVMAIVESGKNKSAEQKKTDRCPLLYEWHKKQYIGAAHGLAGIFYMLMQPEAKVHPDILSELIRPSIDYVRHKRFRSGNFPSSLSNESDRLVHWCHGAPGVIHLLNMAYKVFKEEKYLKEAAECAEVIWQRGLLRKGYGICHGTAGNGYAFLSLYKLTQEKKHLYRACKVRTSVSLLLISSRYLTAVKVLLALTWRSVQPSKDRPPETITDPVDDVTGSITLTTASPDSFTPVTCAQCEPAFICEENGAPMVDLPSLVFSGVCQWSHTVLSCEHRSH